MYICTLYIFVIFFLALEKKKTVVKVPKGTSSYQAAWIVDAQTSEQEDESDDDMVSIMMDLVQLLMNEFFLYTRCYLTDYLTDPLKRR